MKYFNASMTWPLQSEEQQPLEWDMERRQSRRFDASRYLLVYSNGVLVAAGETIDISDSGVLMQLREDLSGGLLMAGAQIDILFDDPHVPLRERQLPAEIVHASTRGLGIMFLQRFDSTHFFTVDVTIESHNR